MFLRESMFKVDCEQCGARFDLARGGVCTVCRRPLCDDHLYGGLVQRLKVTLLGRTAVCVTCRLGVTGPAAARRGA